MNYFCCDELRRGRLKGSNLNGIDYLEVVDRSAAAPTERQRILLVHLVNPLTFALSKHNVRVEGGERIQGIAVEDVQPGFGGEVIEVRVDQPGDFSLYTLRLVRSTTDDAPPHSIDPLFAAVEFSFKVECPTDFDCRAVRICPAPFRSSPEIDYLAKDYASFRRLMLDRLAALAPQWQERNAADLGVALVELLAYVGDLLSYQQDAVATEAYLGTARRRVSVRRHARLADYFMHDGGNARAWVHFTVEGADHVALPARTPLLSRVAQQASRIPPDEMGALMKQDPVVFETMHEALLLPAHNDLHFYTWGNERCCLPRGATRATLSDHPERRLRLRAGDVLVFEETIGPTTGLVADADPQRRHAVRLTRVSPEAERVLDDEGREINRLPGLLVADPLAPEQGMVEIEWSPEDALPFPLCLSAVTDHDHGAVRRANVSIAHGNIALADHGVTLSEESLGTVPSPLRYRLAEVSSDRCAPRDRIAIPARFNPALQHRPLTHAAPFDPQVSAAAAMRWSTRDLLPAITLASEIDDDRIAWQPRRDLLGSAGTSTHFVVESEHDGTASLRFGDGQHGLRPAPGTSFTARYRIGLGRAGNVGADALWHVVSNDSGIVGVRNPLAARGGVEPDTVEEVRQSAPHAFRTQERAVTEADYVAMAERDSRIQRVAATLRWTGSWHTAFVTVDPLGRRDVPPTLERELTTHLDRFRMAGQDLEINGPVFVSLELEMEVCVQPAYFRADVRQALLDLFSNRTQPDGTRGLFHADNFTFGQPVYLSPLYAAAQAVPGVASVHMLTFRRRGSGDNSAVDTGVLLLGRREIAQLDNDRNFAERGVLRLTVGGGK